MSQPTFDVDERLWEMYVQDCQDHGVKARIKDFLIWCEEQDYDLPEAYDDF